MLNLNKTGNFMQKSAIIVLYLKKNYTQLFFVLENFGAFKKNYTQQHSCKSAREPKHTMLFHWLILAHIIFQAESREHDPSHPSSLVGARVHAT